MSGQERSSAVLPAVGELARPGRATSDEVYDAICDRGNLTRRQLLIWAGDRLAPGLPVFVEAGLLHIRGGVEPAIFERAFQAVVGECDALRMVVEDVDGWPRQRLVARVDATVEMVDLSSVRAPAVALATFAHERLARAGSAAGPLFDVALVRMHAEHHVWVFLQHQLIADAWSFRLVHQRMVEHYQRDLRGDDGVSVAPPQFRDYLAYEREYRASSRYRGAQAYWQRRLAPASGRGGAIRPSGGREATRVCRVSRRLGHATTAALRRLAAAQSASSDMGLFIVIASLIVAHVYRTTGTSDVLLSVPFANRPSRRFKETVGSFMNVCPVRVSVERGDTFLSLLRRVEHEAWEAAAHQGWVMSHVAAAQPYDVLVNVHKEAVAARTFGELPMDAEWLAPTHRFGALSVGVQDFNGDGDLILALDFNEATFGSAAREDVCRDLLRLLEGCIADPTRAVDSLRIGSVGGLAETSEGGARMPETPGPSAEDPPQADVAHMVAAIWCEVLGRAAVGLHEDFFELGGDSLLAYRMLVRVGADLLVDLSADAFFERPTVAAVVAAVELAHAQSPARGAIEEALRDVERLSDQEAATLLGEEQPADAEPSDG
jgi:hypothetical protein